MGGKNREFGAKKPQHQNMDEPGRDDKESGKPVQLEPDDMKKQGQHQPQHQGGGQGQREPQHQGGGQAQPQHQGGGQQQGGQHDGERNC